MYFAGELCLLALTLLAWAEKRPERHWLLILGLAWIMGIIGERMVIQSGAWYYAYARLVVLLLFGLGTWHKASRHIFPLALTFITFMAADLFIINEPGIIPAEPWITAAAPLLIAGVTSFSFWGMASAYCIAVVLKQLVTPFLFSGIAEFIILPDPFLWHFTVLGLTCLGIGWVLILRGKEHWLEKKHASECLLRSPGEGTS